MTLGSNLFKDSGRLARTEDSDPAHVVPGDVGDHVRLIQVALQELDGAIIDAAEINEMRYGKSTAAAVLAYKKARNIINRSYQTQADNIVGKMTIKSLDQEMLSRQITPGKSLTKRCDMLGGARPLRRAPMQLPRR